MDNYILEMINISKEFPGVKALNQVNLRIRPGTVHALMGENGAGKSTLMKCLFGIYDRDEGEIIFEGERISFTNARDAIESGISMIHQELYPQIHLSVMENVWVGRLPVKRGFVDYRKMYEGTVRLLKELDIDLDPKARVGNLSVSQMQCIEIVRAVSFSAKVIIMDEPSSSLTGKEVRLMFNIINKLRDKGVSFIYISHRIDEILTISNEVSIMRDGKMIGTWEASELTNDKIISSMVGREMTHLFPKRENVPGEIIMEIKNFTSPFPNCFKDVSLKIRRGEILGIGGLVGAQRTELIEAVFGLRQHQGSILIEGCEMRVKNPVDAKARGMALLTEDRRKNGIFGLLNVRENMAITSFASYVNSLGLLDYRKMDNVVKKMISRFNIRTPSIKTVINKLSGGNQQKVLFARWLITEPDILLLDEPTRGIDVGAKYEIYCIIAELAKQGKSIVMISSEMGELIGMSDRVAVMCEGRLTGELTGDRINEEEIMRLSSKFTSKLSSDEVV
jgi:methyl-galactoside transport system ATP-binding protein